MTAPPGTEGTLLGGRVRHHQPATGHRTGIEPVLLAASIPACAGQRVLEAGSGAGAALLCLAWRVPGIIGLGLERDPALVVLAQHNAAETPNLAFCTTRLEDFAPQARFDHAMANPPWHVPTATASPDLSREAARRGHPGLFAAWASDLAAALRHRGTLTLVIAAGTLAAGVAALTDARCGSLAVLPLWPKPGRPARLLLLRGVKGGRGPSRLLPGLVLHELDGRYTDRAEAILRGGAGLEL